MSHKATYWLARLDPATIKAGEFRVLFHLCDHHNDERNAERSCFPSQETLIEKTALSNGGLNNCLNNLERAGLLIRKRGTIPGTSTRRTYYILGCDADLSTMQTPLSGDSPNSTPLEAAKEQTPLFEGANSTFQGGKLQPTGEEPVREPVRGKKETPIVPTISKRDQERAFDLFWAVFPRKVGKGDAVKAFAKAIRKTEIETILSAAERYAKERDGQDHKYTKHPAPWLNAERWHDEAPPDPGANFHDQVSQILRGTDGLQHTPEIDNRPSQHVPAALPSPGTSRSGSEPDRTSQHGGRDKLPHLGVVRTRGFG